MHALVMMRMFVGPSRALAPFFVVRFLLGITIAGAVFRRGAPFARESIVAVHDRRLSTHLRTVAGHLKHPTPRGGQDQADHHRDDQKCFRGKLQNIGFLSFYD